VTDVLSGSLSVVDTATHSVTASFVVGASPDSIGLTPDGTRAYVANAGSDPRTCTTTPGSVAVVDTDPASPTYDMVVASIDVASGATGVAISPNGRRTYVANRCAGSVSVIDSHPSSGTFNTVIATIPVGDGPFAVTMAPNGARAYVSNEVSSSITVVDTASSTALATLPLSSAPRGLDVTPDGSRLYVALHATARVVAVDAATLEVLGAIAVENGPTGLVIAGATPTPTPTTPPPTPTVTVPPPTPTATVPPPTPTVTVPPPTATATARPRPGNPPVCVSAFATPGSLWPPNHTMHAVQIQGVTHPDGSPLSLAVTGVFQDEPVNGTGDGDTSPDATLSPLQVRAERSGGGNGRVYHIAFTAVDAGGRTCTGEVTVCVPHSANTVCSDGGALYDSTANGGAAPRPAATARPRPTSRPRPTATCAATPSPKRTRKK
jgi:YVTN family beta-propeller protein